MNLQQDTNEVQSNEVQLLRDVMTHRIIEAKFGFSFVKKTPQIELVSEIIAPESTKVVGGKTVKVAGLKAGCTFYLTQAAAKRLAEFNSALGLENNEFDEKDEAFMADYVKRYLGKAFNAVTSSEKFEQTKETWDENADNIDGGKGAIVKVPMLDDTGKPMVSFRHQIGRVVKPRPELNVDMAF